MKYKKYWKIILALASLLLLAVFFISNIEITKPENNIVEGNIAADNNDNLEEDSDEEIKAQEDKAVPNEEEKKKEAANEEASSAANAEEQQATAKKENKESTVGSSDNKETASEVRKTSSVQAQAEEDKEYYSFSIDCYTVLDNKGDLKKGKEGCLGNNGLIFSGQVEGKEGMTVKQLLLDVCKKNNIKVLCKGDYIVAINNLKEKDCGKLSGWMYSVNGVFPMLSVGDCKIKKGDVIKFRYTCKDCGKDLV